MNYIIKQVKVILQFKKNKSIEHSCSCISCAYQEQESKFVERSLQHTYLQKIVLNKMSIPFLNKHFRLKKGQLFILIASSNVLFISLHKQKVKAFVLKFSTFITSVTGEQQEECSILPPFQYNDEAESSDLQYTLSLYVCFLYISQPLENLWCKLTFKPVTEPTSSLP